MLRLYALLPLLLPLGACQREPAADATATPHAQVAPEPGEAVAATTIPDSPATEAAIRVEDLAAHIRILASDEFAGRQPGGPGERKTVAYLTREFQRIGLAPGNGDSYTQAVPMVEIVSEANRPVLLRHADGSEEELALTREVVVQTMREDAEVHVQDSPLVFVGFGVVAPELGWNDYAGVDVRGKTVVVLINDPGFETGDEELFRGRAMTYYGRWTYKYEEAFRQGAAAALIVHDDAGASYPWEVVQNSFSGAKFDLPRAGAEPEVLAIRGWITTPAAERLFARLGHDLPSLRLAANRPGFQALELDARIDMGVATRVRRASSSNVAGLLRGSENPEELIVFTAHWDHLGRNFQTPGDGIFNGAIDNASGVAAMLEIAEAFASAAQPPRRSLLFLAVTLEESGLLGSRHYVQNPVFPLQHTVAAINIDAMHATGRTRDVVVVGYGNSELEDVLKRAAAVQGRIVVPEPTPENGFYYRSDHFSFARAGVPALYARSGVDHLEYGEEYGLKWSREYVAQRYHKPGDEYDPEWDLSGNVENAELVRMVAQELADGGAWPNWFEGNEFRAARDAMELPAAARR